MKTEEEKIEEISRVAALLFTTARAFNLWNAQLEFMAHKLKMCHTYETKYALGQIEDGCKKIAKGLEHFEDWAFNAAKTDSGHSQDAEALDAYLQDGSIIAVLSALLFNATACDKNARLKIESELLLMIKSKPLISFDLIDKVRVK